jgi:hypothetical protein
VIDLDQVFSSVALILNQLGSLGTNEGGQGARHGKSVFREIAELKDENLTNPQVRSNAIFACPFAFSVARCCIIMLPSKSLTVQGSHVLRLAPFRGLVSVYANRPGKAIEYS